MVEERDIVADVELHLLNEWHLRSARDRRRQRDQHRQAAEQQRMATLYWSVAGVLMLLAGAILLMWG